ncbi:MAG: carboxypeptidase-like regulatory domain-containing protein [Bacteroidales bacterium]|nr:carboxypeptidase-like regulatory domain-containing protein [Bacteroidales bacterium]
MRLTIILLLATFNLFAQNIKGIILDAETNIPLEYVNISFKKENTGTTSNIKGEFNLSLQTEIAENDTVHFSIIGYYSEDYTYSKLKEFNFVVSLTKKVENIEEIEIKSNRILNPELQYSKLPSTKVGVHSFGTELIEGKIYIIGGDASYIEDSGKKLLDELSYGQDYSFGYFISKTKLTSTWEHYSGKLQIFDIENKSWVYPEIEFRKRAYHNIRYCNNKLYVLGGKSISLNGKFEYLENKIEIFDLKTQTIEVDETNPHQAINFQSFVYKNSIIVMGGSVKLNKDGSKIFSNKVHLYDLTKGYWYELNDMPKAKEVKGVIIDSTIYLIGGNNNRPLKGIDSYKLSTDIWEPEGELFSAIEKPALTTFGNIIYIFSNDKILTFNIDTKLLNEYKIDLNLFASELYYFDGKLYIVGGYNQDEFTKSVSKNMYCVDIKEFSNTEIVNSRKY